MSSIGKIIKGLAVGLTILGLLGSLILYFVGNSAYEEDKDYLKYATINGGGYGHRILEEAGNNAYNGLQLRKMAIISAVCIAVSALPFYGFGVLVENSELLRAEAAAQNARLNALQATHNQTLAALDSLKREILQLSAKIGTEQDPRRE